MHLIAISELDKIHKILDDVQRRLIVVASSLSERHKTVRPKRAAQKRKNKFLRYCNTCKRFHEHCFIMATGECPNWRGSAAKE
jgi:hypothetical protein